VFTALLFLACGKTDPNNLTAADITAIRVQPDELTLATRLDAPAERTFTAWATLAEPLPSGETEVAIELVSWASSSAATGEIDTTGNFTSSDTNGGVTTITASHLGIEGSSTVTVIYEDYRVVGVDESVVDAFEQADPSAGGAEVVYPLDGARVPRNLASLAFAWEPPGSHDVYRLRLQSDLSDVSVYTDSPSWEADADLWAIIASSNRGGEVAVTVESGKWSGGSLSDVARGPASSVIVNRLDARGSVLYWTSVGESIMRIPLGAEEADVYWQDPEGRCVGCHAINEAEGLMGVVNDGWNGPLSYLDLYDIDEPELVVEPADDRRASFIDFHPDGSILATVGEGQLSFRDGVTGAPLFDYQTDYPFSMPDWSPSGDALLGVQAKGQVLSDADMSQSEIVEFDWDGSRPGSPQVIGFQEGNESLFAPSYSPDGDWIAYLRVPEGSTHFNPDSELWLMSRGGDIQIPLDNAMGDSLHAGYPRWGPLPDDDFLWLAWSAVRDYPPDETASTQPQIWVTAIDTSKAVAGEDPSSPAFWLTGQDPTGNNHLPVWWKE